MTLTPVRSSHSAIAGPASLLDANDCAVKALAVATGFSYDDCHSFLELHGRKRGCGTHTALILNRQNGCFPELGFRAHGLISWSRPTPAVEAGTFKTGVTLRAFARAFPQGSYLVTVSGHALSVVDGVVYDGSAKDLRRIRNAWQIERL
jgi:hypothetical protein